MNHPDHKSKKYELQRRHDDVVEKSEMYCEGVWRLSGLGILPVVPANNFPRNVCPSRSSCDFTPPEPARSPLRLISSRMSKHAKLIETDNLLIDLDFDSTNASSGAAVGANKGATASAVPKTVSRPAGRRMSAGPKLHSSKSHEAVSSPPPKYEYDWPTCVVLGFLRRFAFGL